MSEMTQVLKEVRALRKDVASLVKLIRELAYKPKAVSIMANQKQLKELLEKAVKEYNADGTQKE